MSERIPRVTCEEVVRVLKKVGFEELRQKGSHLHLRRLSEKRRVTVSIHKGREVPPGTLKGIPHDADLSIEQFRELL